MKNIQDKKIQFNIGVIGLGYVGLPLAIEFGKMFHTIGYDISKNRIKALKAKKDSTNQINNKEFKKSKYLKFTNFSIKIKDCNIYIITVPTPIFKNKLPDLSHIKKASKLVGKILKKNDIVIYESTVYPGLTEEICVPILEKQSKFSYNKDFFCGYSPERINPGDKKYNLKNIIKVVSGSNINTTKTIKYLYSTIIKAGVFVAKNIKTAEAAKVIENTQRDINIALINEIALICKKLNIDSREVLKAASTKWNFLNFQPGIVGGHCIGVDPYYLTYKSLQVGYNPKMILSGRTLNDNMPKLIFKDIKKIMSKKNISIESAKILILGLAFKENCNDFRNTKVFDLANQFINSGASINIFDPWISKKNLNNKFKKKLITKIPKHFYDCIIIAVSHNIFRKYSLKDLKNLCKNNHVIYDIKNLFKNFEVDGRL